MTSIIRAIKTEAKHMRLEHMFDRENLPEQLARHEIIRNRRGAFKWLPCLCSNDLVHGSWWFVWGSLGGVFFAILPLIVQENSAVTDDSLPSVDYDITWAILTFSGVLFTIGSLFFVRAFEEPPIRPLLYNYKHFQTDELLAAWFFLAGTVPAVPYFFVYFIVNPSATMLGAMGCCLLMIMGCLLFVFACYPNEKKSENYCLPIMLKYFGDKEWIRTHLANDWLAGTWFFLYANILLTVGSFGMLFIAAAAGNPKEIFLYSSSVFNSTLFLVGSLYYVSGSYPHEGQFYYARDPKKSAAIARKRRATFSDDKAGNATMNPILSNELDSPDGKSEKKLSTLTPIIEGDCEQLSPQTSSDNLAAMGMGSPSSDSGKNAAINQPKTAWNPLHSPKPVMKSVGGTPSPGGKISKKTISSNLGHDIDF